MRDVTITINLILAKLKLIYSSSPPEQMHSSVIFMISQNPEISGNSHVLCNHLHILMPAIFWQCCLPKRKNSSKLLQERMELSFLPSKAKLALLPS